MSTMPAAQHLTLDLLPARHGDAILLSWGPGENRHRMLVDGGPAIAYRTVAPRLAELVGAAPLDLVVLTHIDGDHIEGLILLTNDADLGFDVNEIWFNGSGMLTKDLGAIQGEILAALIQVRDIPWNIQTNRQAICRAEDGAFRTLSQADGLQLTVLGPDRPTLRRLRDDWVKVCKDARLTFGSVDDALAVLRRRSNLRPSKGYLSRPPIPNVPALAAKVFAKDLALANRTSIVLLAEYGDVRVLLAGDATPGALLPAVQALLKARGVSQLPLTAFKLPHHGSARNVTRELVRLLPADYYLFSSDGTQFSHPDDTAVAIVLEHGRPGAELVFNYRNDQTSRWSDARLAMKGYRFPVRYPESNDQGVRVTLSPVPPSSLLRGRSGRAVGEPPTQPSPRQAPSPPIDPGQSDLGRGRDRSASEGDRAGRDVPRPTHADRGQPRVPIGGSMTETITVSVNRHGAVRAHSSNRTGESNGRLHDDPVDLRLIRHFERWLALRERVWDEEEVRTFGLLLHRRLFGQSPDVWNWLQRKLDTRRRSPIRIQLEFPDGDTYADLAALPWEYLHTPETTGRAGDFLAAKASVVLSRYVPRSLEASQFKAQESLQLLPVIADPDPYGLGEVDYEPALAAIEALDPASGITVLPALLDASPPDLQREIVNSRPDIVHFIGHGQFDPGPPARGSLALNDPAGGTKWVTEKQLVTRLCPPSHVPRIVVLHTCEGGRPDFEDRFAGLGPALIRAGVQYVAGMQYAVPNEVAITFTENLYALLAERAPVDQAVHECRFALADISDDPRLLGFPVLYQCGTDPVLKRSRRVT